MCTSSNYKYTGTVNHSWYLFFSGETQPLAGSPDDYDKGPLESDKDSLEEYGDPDPSRFNEDGSFIGQYGAEKMTASEVAAPSAMHTFV